jgi:hypothetical protein
LDTYRPIFVVDVKPHPSAPIHVFNPIYVSERRRECALDIGVGIFRIVDVRGDASYTNSVTNLEGQIFH